MFEMQKRVGRWRGALLLYGQRAEDGSVSSRGTNSQGGRREVTYQQRETDSKRAEKVTKGVGRERRTSLFRLKISRERRINSPEEEKKKGNFTD